MSSTASSSSTTTNSGGTLLGAFYHSSPFQTVPHDPSVNLASHCIRMSFGETVQAVADVLQSKGPLTFKQIIQYIDDPRYVHLLKKQQQKRGGGSSGGGSGNSRRSQAGIRAALLVLIQHSMCTVKPIIKAKKEDESTTARKSEPMKKKSAAAPMVQYKYHKDRAIAIVHYAKYVDWIKRAYHNDDATIAVSCIETLLIMGRLRTLDLIDQASDSCIKQEDQQRQQQKDDNDDDDGEEDEVDPEKEIQRRQKQQRAAMEVLVKLVASGFVERAPEIKMPGNDTAEDGGGDDDDGEYEFEGGQQPQKKKIKTEEKAAIDPMLKLEDKDMLKLWQDASIRLRSMLPIDTVWRVNVAAFRDCLRALTLGVLVAERHGGKVKQAGSLVSAALRYRAHKRYGGTSGGNNDGKKDNDGDGGGSGGASGMYDTTFSPTDTVKFLPKAVIQSLEQKNAGGVAASLAQAWEALSEQHQPEVVGRMPGEDRYDMDLYNLMGYMRDRVVRRIIQQRHGVVAARIVSILLHQGWLESDTITKQAMVPAKDTRAHLHALYKSRYVGLYEIPTTRQHNRGAAINLWYVDHKGLLKQITQDVIMALWHIRLRRQHQVEDVGREWIERAQQQADIDENENAEADKLNYERFCLGLERLDQAAIQLADTLMILQD